MKNIVSYIIEYLSYDNASRMLEFKVCSRRMLQINSESIGSQIRWRSEQLHSCAPMFNDMTMTNGFKTSEHVT